MANKRVYELAKELNLDSKAIIAEAGKKGIDVKNHMSTLDESQAKILAGALGKGGKTVAKGSNTKSTPDKTTGAKKEAGEASAADAKKPVHRFKHNYISRNRRASANPEKIQKAEEAKRKAAQAKKQAEDAKRAEAEKKALEAKRAADRANTKDYSKPVDKPKRPTHVEKPVASHTNKTAGNGTSRPSSSNNRAANNNNHSASNNHPTNSNHSANNNHPSSSRPAQSRPATSQGGQGKFGGSLNRNKKKNKKKGRNGNRRNENRYNMYSKNQRIRQQQKKKPTVRKERPLPKVLEYEDSMNAQDLSKLLHRDAAEIVKKLFMLGIMVNQNQSLDKEAIELLAADYNIEAKEKEHENVSDIDKTFDEEMQNTAVQEDRPPVVTIMGHVDHGKTTLLDHLRHSHITSGEAGGITQAIGAYQLNHEGKKITFLDTPGHAAFTEMRARGANITDITVLVVAADDGVMPQTIEAIDHAKAAKTPIVVAVNKIDKAGANPQHVKEQLMEYGLVPEDFGGDTIFVDISAKTGKNVDELLNMILLQADVMELKANPDQNGAGSVVEAKLDKGKGPVATLLVQQGTLNVGDPVVVGDTFGRVRTMTNENGKEIKSATPSTPVEITGLNDVPDAGDRFITFDDEKSARAAGEERAKEAQIEERKQTNRVTLDNLFDSMKDADLKQVNVIIKADVQGSVEALAGSLKKIDVEGVKVNVIHSSVGAINESDVALAEASNAIIIGFNVRATPQAKSQAESDKVDIRLYQVIYNAIDDVQDAMMGMLDPEYEEEVTGNVEVRDIFKASKVGTIAGGMVQDGVIYAGSKVRLVRDGVVKYDGELGSLKRFKDDVKEVKQGFECGLTIQNFNDIKVGDVVEAYRMKEIPRKAMKSNGKDASQQSVKPNANKAEETDKE